MRATTVSAAALIATLLLAGCGGSVRRDAAGGIAPAAHGVGSSGVPRHARHPLTVHIHLSRTTARAGGVIAGTATVVNSSTHPVTIADCDGTWLQVGLVNEKIHFTPMWLDCLDVPGTVLRGGTTRVRIALRTRYNACTNDAGTATADMPACGRGGEIPTLPPGSYTTKVALLEPKDIHVPPPGAIHVTITQ